MYLVTVGSYGDHEAMSVHFSKESAVEEAKSFFTGPHKEHLPFFEYVWYAEGPMASGGHGFASVGPVKVRW